MFGGLSLLNFLTSAAPGIVNNPLRHDLFRAGHAHAGVYLVLSLVMLRYADEAALSPFGKWIARLGAPVAAILIPAAFFLSVASPTATIPRLRWGSVPGCGRVNSWRRTYPHCEALTM